MLDTFVFAREKLLNEQILMKQNVKQNKVHDEQIIMAKVRQEKFKQQESTTFMNKKNNFFVNCYGNKFGYGYHV